jgi:TatA/E family protein of Tat protein translocase
MNGMDLFGGHLPELIILLVVILIIWGPGKLPDIGMAVGRGIREFRKASAETRDAVAHAMATPEQAAAPAPAEPSPAPEPEPASTPGGPANPPVAP